LRGSLIERPVSIQTSVSTNACFNKFLIDFKLSLAFPFAY
jgi:hypothetical protein